MWDSLIMAYKGLSSKKANERFCARSQPSKFHVIVGFIKSTNNREEPPTILRGKVQGRVVRREGAWGTLGARAGSTPGTPLSPLLAGGVWGRLRQAWLTYLGRLRPAKLDDEESSFTDINPPFPTHTHTQWAAGITTWIFSSPVLVCSFTHHTRTY